MHGEVLTEAWHQVNAQFMLETAASPPSHLFYDQRQSRKEIA